MCCARTEKVFVDKHGVNHKEFDVISVAPASKKIGLGASLLLMTIKALVWLFLWLTILNVPLLMLVYKGAVMDRPEVTIGYQTSK